MFSQGPGPLSWNLGCWKCLETSEREFRISSAVNACTTASVDVVGESKSLLESEIGLVTTNRIIPCTAAQEVEADKTKRRRVPKGGTVTTHALQDDDSKKPVVRSKEGHPSGVSNDASVCSSSSSSSSSRGGAVTRLSHSFIAHPDDCKRPVILRGTKTESKVLEYPSIMPVTEKCHLLPVGVHEDARLGVSTDVVDEKRKRGRPRKKPL